MRLSRRADRAWLRAALRLGMAAEARRRTRPAARAPLVRRRWRPSPDIFAQRFREFLPSRPIRCGSGRTSTPLSRCASRPTTPRARGDAALHGPAAADAERWYEADADCPAWGEPGGDDFLSSALIEAECMRRLLPPARFAALVRRGSCRALRPASPATLFRPAAVTDRSDGKIAHLDGLNLSRAWCLRALAAALPPGDAACRRSCGGGRARISRPACRTWPATTWASTGWRASRCWPWRGEGGLRPGGAACQPKLSSPGLAAGKSSAGPGAGSPWAARAGGTGRARTARSVRERPPRRTGPRTRQRGRWKSCRAAGPSWTMATIRIRSSHIAQPAFDGA